MAAAIQHAAGGAFLGAASSPAAADFTWRALAAAAPRLLRLMHQRHASSSAPRALHALLHRPSLRSAAAGSVRRPGTAIGSSPRLFHSHVHRPAGAIAGAKPSLPMIASTRSFSSQDKYYSDQLHQLQEEEAKMKKKKALAVALMNGLPKPSPDAADHGEMIDSVNHLFDLLDVPDATANDAEVVARQVEELRSLVEKKINALLIEILHKGDVTEQKKAELLEQKKAELVDAGRQLRDFLLGQDERHAFQTIYKDVKSLQQRVAAFEYNYKMLSNSVAAGRMEFESANANANSIRADVSRLGVEVTSIKNEAKAAQMTAGSVSTNVDKLETSVAQGRKEAESAYGLALFLGFCAAGGALTALAIV